MQAVLHAAPIEVYSLWAVCETLTSALLAGFPPEDHPARQAVAPCMLNT